MCRYCKNLKRLKDLDEKEYKKIIDKWRNRDFLARKIIDGLLDYISTGCPIEKADVVFSAIGYVSSKWIGK